LNFKKLFSLPDDEVTQILVHQMMHLAGYTHRKRHDPPGVFPDVPGDGGEYYGSTPLKAEMCIAGRQSDAIVMLNWDQLVIRATTFATRPDMTCT
jgi:hypothetical protein